MADASVLLPYTPLAMLVVGLTGGIGSGKSRVAELLEEFGAGLACSDGIVRELQARGTPLLAEIARTFGDEVIRPDGELDRARLGAIVFHDPEKRLRLNLLVHPRVTAKLREAIARFRAQGRAVAVLDIPLLLEGRVAGRGSGAELPFDVIAVVWSSEEQQLERIAARDGLSEADARARIRAQMPLAEKRRHADVVIDNSGSWEATAKQVRELYAEWARRGAESTD